jgi:hypothetical protein
MAVIHGVTSDGFRWQFLRLTGAELEIEIADRLISDPDRLFGILLHICGVHPDQGPA